MKDKKHYYSILVTNENDIPKIEKALFSAKIKEYEVFEEINIPRVDLYATRDQFARVALKLDLCKVWY